MKNLFTLSAKDIETLRRMLERENTRTVPNQARSGPPVELDWSQDVYIGYTPVDGIPPTVQDPDTTTIGKATLDLYQVRQGTPFKFVPAGSKDYVVNLSGQTIPGNTWVQVTKDKYGTWLVSGNVDDCNEDSPTTRYVSNVCYSRSSGSGLPTITVEYTTVRICDGEILDKVCVSNPNNCCEDVTLPCCPPGVVLPSQLCFTFGGALAYLGSLTFYFNPPYAAYTCYIDIENAGDCWDNQPCNCVVLAFKCLDANTWVMLDSLSPSSQASSTGPGCLVTGQGCGGNLAGEFGDGSPIFSHDFNCHTATGTVSGFFNTSIDVATYPCQGQAWDAVITPGSCEPGTGTGTGTGTSSNDDNDTSTICCPSDIIPTTIYANLFGATACDCIEGSYPLTWDPFGQVWTYFATLCGGTLGINLQCYSGLWRLLVEVVIDGDNVVSGSNTITATCTLPLDFGTITMTVNGGGSVPLCPGGTIEATVSL